MSTHFGSNAGSDWRTRPDARTIVPSVYLETTIPSYLVARLSPDGELAAKQASTRSWWENRRHRYETVDGFKRLLSKRFPFAIYYTAALGGVN